MTTPTNRLEKIAGLLLILGLLAWGVGIVARGRTQDWFHRRPLLTFALGDAHGLVEGARVQMSGVPVGSVRSVHLMEDNLVLVTVEILPDHAGRLREGLRAQVEPPSFWGGTEVVLIPGSGERMLPPGSRIHAEVKAGATDGMGEAVEKIVALGDNLEAITRSLRDGEGSLGALLKDEGGMHSELTAVMQDARKAIDEYRKLGESGTDAVGDMREVFTSLQKEVDQIGVLIEDLTPVTEKIDGLMETVAQREEGLPSILKELRLVLTDLREAIIRITDEVPQTAESARHTTAEARRLIRATERNFLIRPNLEPLPPIETSVSASRRWDPYED